MIYDDEPSTKPNIGAILRGLAYLLATIGFYLGILLYMTNN